MKPVPLIPREFGERFRRHMVALEVFFTRTGGRDPQHVVFSGFLLEHGGVQFWVTAAHCLDALRMLHSDVECDVIAARWSDRFDVSAAAVIPTDLDHVLSLSVSRRPPDVGVVLPRLNAQQLLRANPSVAPLSACTAPEPGHAHVGYCIVGLPSERIDSSVSETNDNWITSWNGQVACITSHLDLPADHDCVAQDFWGDQDCMYGHIDCGEVLDSIVGMSGGPVFSVSRQGDQWSYRLVGVQSAWMPHEQIVRIARIEPVVAIAEDVLAEARRIRGRGDDDMALISSGA